MGWFFFCYWFSYSWKYFRIIAGYYGRWVDTIISRLFDIMLAFPSILLAIAIVSVLGPSLQNALLQLQL